MSDFIAESGLQYLQGEVGNVVPEGYKQTEVGMIPEDWATPKFSEICRLINGRGFKPHEWHSSGLPIIRIQNLNGSDEFNYFEGHFDPKIFVRNSQLLFAWSGSRGTSFGPHIWSGDDALLNYHTWKLVLKEGKVEEGYFFHILKFLTKKIEESAHGASALVHTQKGEMEQLLVPLPTLKAEQTAIANALSDIDALISEQEKLIAKKQAIKTATMQQLLTGRTRLPQFALRNDGAVKGYKQSELGEVPEDWEVTTIGACTSWMSGGTPSRGNELFWSGSIPWISGSTLKSFELYTSDQFLSDTGVKSGSKMAPLGAVLLLVRGSALHNEIRAGVVIAPLAFNQDVKALVPTEALDAWYLTLYIKAMDGELLKLVSSAGNSAGVLDTELVKKFWLLLPSIDEQKTIAFVLTEMDKNLKSLQNRLTKSRQIKQGIMQELLTGKTRLFKPAVKESANV